MKIPKQAYTPESKERAVKGVKGVNGGQSVGMVCGELGLSDQTLRNGIKAAAEGKLNGAGGRVVTAEERELSRLRAENKCGRQTLPAYGPMKAGSAWRSCSTCSTVRLSAGR